MHPLDRREFIFDTGRLAAALAAAGLLQPATIAAEAGKEAKRGEANDRLRVAVIGANKPRGRGLEHVGFIAGKNNCELVTICDCDESVIGAAMTKAEKQQGKLPKYEKDLRKVMEDPSIDVISIATPNHWHALAAIWAMQAGKHVYVEKPVSHNVSEGRRIVEAAAKYNKICQTGTQIRSMSGIREAMDYLHTGKLGKVTLARGLCYKPRASIGQVNGDGEIPATIDYDLWCGPAPKRPPRRQKLHYDWHWQWDYGNGDLGNQGIHQMDVARWGLNRAGLPQAAVSLGGRFAYVDDGETANTQVCIFDYGDAKLIFEVRGLMTQDLLADQRGRPTTDKKMQAKVGNAFYGEKGILICSTYTDAVALDHDDAVLQVFKSKKEDDHFGNFANAVRSGRPSDLNAPIEGGHLSSALCHLGNISYRLGHEVPFGSAESKSYAGDKDSVEPVARMLKHLEANKVNLDEAKCRMGVPLTLDPKAERFRGNKEANVMLTREYRKGFEVPAKM
jgi:predicted dehydrogenase